MAGLTDAETAPNGWACRITTVTLYPPGYDPALPGHALNVRDFTVQVEWHGEVETGTRRPRGGYGVVRGRVEHLSRGGKWGPQLYLPKMSTWQYRWATFEEAFAAACDHADDPSPEPRRRTWPQVMAWLAERET